MSDFVWHRLVQWKSPGIKLFWVVPQSGGSAASAGLVISAHNMSVCKLKALHAFPYAYMIVQTLALLHIA